MSEALKVGQVLWYVPERGHGQPHEVTVTKIGTKWATLDEGWRQTRIDKRSLWADGRGYSSPGRCYLSHEAYETQRRVTTVWRALSQKLWHSSVQAGVTEDDILAAAKLLRLEITGEGL